ncbi:reticulon-2 [Ambystoma mexicanum]|uniref:reticulon-2 n=1 Tax=Ambystoma mexicanum TaxID=8296 RepID=UPI0037E9B008
MGQVLGFAHCKDAPSTASSTPDSTPEATDGGNDESDFPELQTAREFSEDEEETSLDWGTPRELTFSYITFAGSGADGIDASFPPDMTDLGAQLRRDSSGWDQGLYEGSSRHRRTRAQPGLVRTDTCETFLPDLTDSLESIPSLSHSPETECRLQAQPSLEMSEPFFGWGEDIAYADDPEFPGSDTPPIKPESKISHASSPPCGTETWNQTVAVPDNNAISQSITSVGEKELDLTMSARLGSLEDHSQIISTESWGQDDSWLRDSPPPLSRATPHRAVCHVTGSQRPSSTSHLNEEEDQLHRETITEGHQPPSEPSAEAMGLYVVVADLVYWRNTQTSAIVCTSLVVSMLCLSQFSIISVCSYVALLVLCATITLRVYRKILQAVSKSDGVNPFQVYLDEDVSLSKEQVDKYAELALAHLTSALKTLRHLFLVEDLVDSLKLLVLLYLFTYIGAVFNGLTLLILGVISAFSLPLLYRQHQTQIDQYVGLARNHLSQIRAKIQAKLPTTKPKEQ